MKEQKILGCASSIKDSLGTLKGCTGRNKIVSTLKSVSSGAKQQLKEVRKNSLGNYPDLLEAREVLTSVSNSISGIADAIGNRRIDIRTYQKQIEGVLTSVSTVEELVSRHNMLTSESAVSRVVALDDVEGKSPVLDDSKMKYEARERMNTFLENDANSDARRKEGRAIIGSTRSRNMIQALKSKYAQKIPHALDVYLKVVEVPLLARFGTMALNAKSLKSLGFEVESMGVDSATSADIGTVFYGQNLLLFSADNAMNEAQMQVDNEKQSDTVLIRRKNLQAARNRLNRELKDLAAIRDESKSPKMIDNQIAEATAKVSDIEAKLAEIEDASKGARHRINTRAKKTLQPNAALSNYAENLIELINKKSSVEYSLVTTQIIRGITSDTDMCGAWIMPKSYAQTLIRQCGGELKLKQWGLPWGKGG